MLEDTDSAISFNPGGKKQFSHTSFFITAVISLTKCTLLLKPVRTQSIPGSIIVHDRAQVESQVLPRYFNHASFASLRRQLNYFAFSREGKGKQKGATYTNDQVFDLEDILNLKRRLPGVSAPLIQKAGAVEEPETVTLVPVSTSVAQKVSTVKRSSVPCTTTLDDSIRRSSRANKNARKIIESAVPVVHLPNKKVKHAGREVTIDTTTSMATSIHPEAAPDSPNPSRTCSHNSSIQTLLDLTKPEEEEESTCSTGSLAPEGNWAYRPIVVNRNVWFQVPTMPQTSNFSRKEEDVLAGCSALLSLGWKA